MVITGFSSGWKGLGSPEQRWRCGSVNNRLSSRSKTIRADILSKIDGCCGCYRFIRFGITKTYKPIWIRRSFWKVAKNKVIIGIKKKVPGEWLLVHSDGYTYVLLLYLQFPINMFLSIEDKTLSENRNTVKLELYKWSKILYKMEGLKHKRKLHSLM